MKITKLIGVVFLLLTISSCYRHYDTNTESKSPAVISDVANESQESIMPKSPGLIDEESIIEPYEADVAALCHAIGSKLGSVSTSDCDALQMRSSGIFSVKNRALAIKDFLPSDDSSSLGKVLVIGGIHGDEYSSVSIMFKWMKQLTALTEHSIHWRFMPSVNPDGLLLRKSQRQNINGIDLNRNFPSNDWDRLAIKFWKKKSHASPRRNPGIHSASEPETQGLIAQIQTFKPDIIVSVHAPYHLLDYDGPHKPPGNIGDLYLHQLGVYPGSLGNYAGIDWKLPVVTIELPHAGIMPTQKAIKHMWSDLNEWIRGQLEKEGELKPL